MKVHHFYFTGRPHLSPETTEYPEYGLLLTVTEEDIESGVEPIIDRVVSWCQEGSNALREYEREHGLAPGFDTFGHQLADVEVVEE